MYHSKIKKVSDKTELQRLRKGTGKYGVPKEIYVDCNVCKIGRQEATVLEYSCTPEMIKDTIKEMKS